MPKKAKAETAKETKKKTTKKAEAKTDSGAAKEAAGGEQQFAIQRIYIKDLSFESPSAPQSFRDEWEPNVELELNTQSVNLAEDIHEVTLKLLVTVKNQEKTGFLVEIQQAGIFSISNFPEEQLKQLLGSYCPSILYPYAREAVSDIVTRGSYPQLLLAPVNFDALYAQHLAESSDKTAA
ncbi:MAG: protein-export chaperone SecB [Legionellales bacterium]|nr:protein-export chaperone SecB [Legionellales bacterium]|tara:strand:- start:19224 stop:19763 length:540 start_codon:yes stop_codon:yes gene_type:complete